MESLKIHLTDSGFHIEGFPDATKAIKLCGPKAQQLSELASHRNDLEIALASLEGINGVDPENALLRQSLWRSAVEHCMKCFSSSEARSKLNPKSVFRGNPNAQEAYRYFRNLRNKHLAHDENAYSQCIPGAVLNGPHSPYKIAKIVCLSAVADTLEQGNYGNLHKMVTETLSHIDARFESLCSNLTEELEARSYGELEAMEEMTYSKPELSDIGNSRARH